MSKQKIYLRPVKSYIYKGIFKYHMLHDYSAGTRNRYTLLVLTSEDPVTIGREISKSLAIELISQYEEEAAKLHDYVGERVHVLHCMAAVAASRVVINWVPDGPKVVA